MSTNDTQSAAPRRPVITIDVVDVGPEDLYDQLPITAEIYDFRRGPDNDYALAVARSPLSFHASADVVAGDQLNLANADPQMFHRNDDGSVDLVTYGLVLAPRMADTTFNPAMKNFPVALAYVIDNSLFRETGVDFSKCYYAAVAFITVREPATGEGTQS